MQAFTGRSARPATRSARVGSGTSSASSATITVQAPQSPSAQPSLVPQARASSRSHCSTLRVGSPAGTLTASPRKTKRRGAGEAVMAAKVPWRSAVVM
jgi:hypothetical protein